MMNILKDKRGAFLAQDWVISLIIFSGFIGLIMLFVTSTAVQYDNTTIIDATIDAKYNQLTNSTNIASQAFQKVSEKGGLTLVGAFDVLFASAFSIISLVLGSLGLATSFTANFAVDFGIPTQVANILFPMILSIITIIIVFVIVNSTTRRDI